MNSAINIKDQFKIVGKYYLMSNIKRKTHLITIWIVMITNFKALVWTLKNEYISLINFEYSLKNITSTSVHLILKQSVKNPLLLLGDDISIPFIPMLKIKLEYIQFFKNFFT